MKGDPGSHARFAVASGVAFLVTAVLFLVMTKLIVDPEHSPLEYLKKRPFKVQLQTPTIEDSEIRRQVYQRETEPPNRIALPRRPPTSGSNEEPERVTSPEAAADLASDEAKKPSIDWWHEMEKSAQDNDELKRWRLEQGLDEYVSVMQGARPTGRLPKSSAPLEDDVGIGHNNVYGDNEVRVSKNCVLQSTSSGHDHSDFARNLPAIIVCNPPAQKLSLPKFGTTKKPVED